MFDMLPTDDVKSWAFRMAHFGILGAFIGLAIIVLLLLQNVYLIYSVRRLRAEMRGLDMRLNRLLGATLKASAGKLDGPPSGQS
jgi:nitrate/nitrite transporter NarK